MKALIVLLFACVACLGQLGDPAFVSLLTQVTPAPAASYSAWFLPGVGITNNSSTASGNLDSVYSWLDSSGNGNSVKCATGSSPTNYTSFLAGYSGIRFTNTQGALQFTGSQLDFDRNIPGLTAFLVCNFDVIPAIERDLIFFSRNAAGSTRSGLFIGYPTASKLGIGGRTLDTDTLQTFTGSSALSTGVNHIICGVWDNANGTIALYMDAGTECSSSSYQTSSKGNTSDTASANAAIGGTGSISLTASEYVVEVILYRRALTASEITQTMAYLNAKYSVY